MLDNSKAKFELGWKPRLNIEEAIDMVVQWEKKRISGEDPRSITLKQIVAFCEMTKID